MSAPSPAPQPPRPALADRDCSNVNMAPTRSSTFNARSRHSHNSGPKESYAAAAATPPQNNHHNHHHNNHHNHHNHHSNNNNNNSNNNMPRRRSFHSNRSHAQAAQEGYFMRKAAKAIAEKRKAAAAAAAAANGVDANATPSSATASATTAGTADPSATTASDGPAADGLPQRASVPVINVTIDKAGVRIRDGPSPSPGPRGSRRGSHARMSRSASARGRPAADDKENCAAAGNNEPPPSPAGPGGASQSFSRRRASKRDLGRRASKDGFAAAGSSGSLGAAAAAAVAASALHPSGSASNLGATKDGEGSWDGSMPRRQSSRGLIERNARVENRAKRTPVEQDSSERVLQRSLSRQSNAGRDDEVSSRATRNNNKAAGAAAAATTTTQRNTLADGPGVSFDGSEDAGGSSGGIEFKRAQSQIAVSSDLVGLGLDVAPRPAATVCSPQIAPEASVDMLKVDIPPRPAPAAEQPKAGEAIVAATSAVAAQCDTSKAGEDAAATLAGAMLTKVRSEVSQASETSETSEARSSSTADSKMPQCGKWCDDCAGLGMTIAAMLAELEVNGADGSSNAGSNAPKRLSSGKKSWRSVVSQTMLGSSGDSKTASERERARMQQENKVLRTTVEFLYAKIAQLEQRESAPPPPQPPQ